MDYYHIQELNFDKTEWKKGDEFVFDESKQNYFTQLLIKDLGDFKTVRENKIRKIGLIKYINNYLLDYIDKEYSEEQVYYKNQFLEKIIFELKDSLSQYIKWIQEDIFEQIRISHFSSLPSRRHCIWVCKRNQLTKWWSIFCSRDNKFRTTKKKILKLELKGKFHTADGLMIDSDTYKIEDFKTRALKYWEGIIESENEIEILFMGKVKVLEEYPEIDDLNI